MENNADPEEMLLAYLRRKGTVILYTIQFLIIIISKQNTSCNCIVLLILQKKNFFFVTFV